eukprot:TRINITY_DN11284_c0_g2_i1.p1 TRINITY_DN11284_c0_g2~~TRINITY_DN11284_c0_g2_i1.p1  ORF type:complete len:511 (+),score=104.90 TRINITY_DN11284_c0_g2_i1:68-1534(+)
MAILNSVSETGLAMQKKAEVRSCKVDEARKRMTMALLKRCDGQGPDLRQMMALRQRLRGDHSQVVSALNIDSMPRRPRDSLLEEISSKPLALSSKEKTADSESVSTAESDSGSSSPKVYFKAPKLRLLQFRVEDRRLLAASASASKVGSSGFQRTVSDLTELRPSKKADVCHSPHGSSSTASTAASTTASTKSQKLLRSVSAPASQSDDLRRVVKGLLNKICPETVQTIAEKFHGLEVSNTVSLEIVIDLIFKKALTEPHYVETYADLVFALKSVFPEFPCPDGGRPITFRSSLLNVCQHEFEELLEPSDRDSFTEPEDIEERKMARRQRLLANVKFMGHLFLRKLLSAKVVTAVISELVICEEQDALPEEHAVESSCELMQTTGQALEALPQGSEAVSMVCSRLKELEAMTRCDGKPVYCRRLQFVMQDVLDTRAAGWTKKSFRSSAKTKEEIRREQERDIVAKARGQTVDRAEHVVAGLRPRYVTQ